MSRYDVTTDRPLYHNDFVNGNVTYVDVRILAREHRLYKIGKCQYVNKTNPAWQLLKLRFFCCSLPPTNKVMFLHMSVCSQGMLVPYSPLGSGTPP